MRSLLNALEEAVARQALYKRRMGVFYSKKAETAVRLEDNLSEAILLVEALVIKGCKVKQALVNRVAYLYKVRALTANLKHKLKREKKDAQLSATIKMLKSINNDISELEQLLIGVN